MWSSPASAGPPLAADSRTLNITGTDVVGGTGSADFPFLLDRAPRVVLDQELSGAVASPDLRIQATCIDDNPTPCTIIASISETDFVQSTGQMDRMLALGAHDGQTRLLTINARDAGGQQSAVYRTIHIEISPRLSHLGAGGTRMLDVDAGRLLFADSTASRTDARVRPRPGGAEVTVPHGWDGRSLNGFLTDRGAMLEAAGTGTRFDPGAPSRVVEWRDEATVTLNTGHRFGTLVVAGPWGVWASGDEYFYRRDLDAATTLQLGRGRGGDVAPNGDAALATELGSADSPVFWYRAGTLSQIAPNGVNYPVTDGVNAAFANRLPNGRYQITLQLPSGPLPLAPDQSDQPLQRSSYEVNNGWTAYLKPSATGVRQVWSRAPDGTERQVSVFSQNSSIDAVGPNGEVVFRSGTRRYLHTAPYTGSAVDIGGAWPHRVFFLGTELIVLIGRSAFRVN